MIISMFWNMKYMCPWVHKETFANQSIKRLIGYVHYIVVNMTAAMRLVL